MSVTGSELSGYFDGHRLITTLAIDGHDVVCGQCGKAYRFILKALTSDLKTGEAKEITLYSLGCSCLLENRQG